MSNSSHNSSIDSLQQSKIKRKRPPSLAKQLESVDQKKNKKIKLDDQVTQKDQEEYSKKIKELKQKHQIKSSHKKEKSKKKKKSKNKEKEVQKNNKQDDEKEIQIQDGNIKKRKKQKKQKKQNKQKKQKKKKKKRNQAKIEQDEINQEKKQQNTLNQEKIQQPIPIVPVVKQQQQPKKDRKSKKKRKQTKQSSKAEMNSEQQSETEYHPENQKKSQIKTSKIDTNKDNKSNPKTTKRGRISREPIKRKKYSIHERQQQMNKKYRVKKKTPSLNKQSQRVWGNFRAGPYRWPFQVHNKKKKEDQGEEKQEKQQSQTIKVQQGQEQQEGLYKANESQKKQKSKTRKNLSSKQSSVKVQSTVAETLSDKKSRKVKKQDQDNVKEEEDESGSNQSDSLEHDAPKKSKGKSKVKVKNMKKESSKRKGKSKKSKEQDSTYTKEESEKIISLFSVDGGNYPQMMKDLPGFKLSIVRIHLRKLFYRALDIITFQVQHKCERTIKQWQQDQKIEIVRQLHRIRSSNRLLSQSNEKFRQKMIALMRSFNNEAELDKVSTQDIEFLYRRIEAFVRGYNTINRSKRTTSGAQSISEIKNRDKQERYKFSKQVTRKPILSGGHLLSKSVKNQEGQDDGVIDQSNVRIKDPELLIEQWKRQQEIELCKFYVNNNEEHQSLHFKMKEKFGSNQKWRDFELVDRKIDQLIKFAIIKLHNLTSIPYSRQERSNNQINKRMKLEDSLKRENPSQAQEMMNFYNKQRQLKSMFLYDNELFQKQERLEVKHRIFKNLSLLERQIYGHLQSSKAKNCLIKILIEQFPPQEEIQETITELKRFTVWATDDERKHNISGIKKIFSEVTTPQEDQIMVDINKVEIIKTMQEKKIISKEDDVSMKQSIKLPSDHQQSQTDEAIDFQEPENEVDIIVSEDLEEDEDNNKDLSKLSKLYSSLNSQKKI